MLQAYFRLFDVIAIWLTVRERERGQCVHALTLSNIYLSSFLGYTQSDRSSNEPLFDCAPTYVVLASRTASQLVRHNSASYIQPV